MDSRPFYGKVIDREAEKETIEKLLSPYRGEPASEELKKKMHEVLARAKFEGKISIPYTLVLRKDTSGHHRPYVEVVLDTKV